MADLEALDRDDPLRAFRERFAVPKGVIYLDGNSLGCLPRATAARVAEVVEREWGDGLIRSWNAAGWIDLPRRVGDKREAVRQLREVLERREWDRPEFRRRATVT